MVLRFLPTLALVCASFALPSCTSSSSTSDSGAADTSIPEQPTPAAALDSMATPDGVSSPSYPATDVRDNQQGAPGTQPSAPSTNGAAPGADSARMRR